MNDRFIILEDEQFWTTLMFRLSGYFAEAEEKELNGIWIDGFNPLECLNTKTGIEVSGLVWIMDVQDVKSEFNFKMLVPQKMLYKKIDDFKPEVVLLDFGSSNLELRIEKK